MSLSKFSKLGPQLEIAGREPRNLGGLITSNDSTLLASQQNRAVAANGAGGSYIASTLLLRFPVAFGSCWQFFRALMMIIVGLGAHIPNSIVDSIWFSRFYILGGSRF